MRTGITRIEVLVIVVLCLFVVGVGIMLLARQRENGQRIQCMNNLRLIGNAFSAYHSASSADEDAQYLPPSRIAPGYATWAVLLAPYLQNKSPLNEWDVQESYLVQRGEVREALLIMYFCPARGRTERVSQLGDVDAAGELYPGGLGDYASVAGDGSDDHDWTGPKANGALVLALVLASPERERRDDKRILQWRSRTSFASLTRGKAYTFLVGEKHVLPDHLGDAAFGDGSVYNGANPASFSRVAGPGFPLADSPTDPFNKNFGSSHRDICHFLFADSSVRPMANITSEQVLGEMARRGD